MLHAVAYQLSYQLSELCIVGTDNASLPHNVFFLLSLFTLHGNSLHEWRYCHIPIFKKPSKDSTTRVLRPNTATPQAIKLFSHYFVQPFSTTNMLHC